MKKLSSHLFWVILFLVTSNIMIAQESEQHNYTDHKPQYRKWLDSYILDKIEYKPNRTIFHFRFVCNNANSGGATFYPPGGESPWYLKGRGVKKEFDIIAVKNVRRDGILVKNDVISEAFHSDPSSETGHTIFSCEVHFDRLDDDMKEADLIEGHGQEFNRRHFNCFNVKLKTWNDEDLGDENDSKEIVANFEKKYTGKSIATTVAEKKDSKYAPSAKRLNSTNDLVCNKVIVLDKIKFHDNSTKFKGMIAANKTLNIVFNYMKEHPKSTITLYGHSDIFGSQDRNMELSKQRVIKVQRWLTMYGIKARRITYEWFGSKKPLVKEGDVINRRVEIKMICND